jgi:hypothetical protein
MSREGSRRAAAAASAGRVRGHRAFTFAEIMFAVMILGIGFIMVAAMFPVAIRQTQSTLEDVNGVAEAQRGAALMRQLGTAISGYNQSFATSSGALANYSANPAYTNLIVDAQNNANPRAGAMLHSFFEPGVSGNLPYQFVRADLVNQRDHRFAWVPVAYQVDFQPVVGTTGQARTVDINGFATTNDTGQAAYYTWTGSVAYYDSGKKGFFDASGNPVPQGDIQGQVIPAARVLPETARVWIVAVEKRNPDSAEYTTVDRDAGLVPAATAYNANDGAFKPKEVYFKLVEGEDPSAASGGNVYPDTLVFTDNSGRPQEEPAADVGAYVWVADDQVLNVPPAPTNYYRPGAANGRFYRLGAKLPASDFGPGVYELQPGNDMQVKHGPGPDAFYNTKDDASNYYELENLPPRPYDGAPGSPVGVHPYASPQGGAAYAGIPGNPARGFMLGRGLKDPTRQYNAVTNPYVGSVQDVYALPAVTIVLRPQ